MTAETGFYVEALTVMSSLGAAETGGALKAEIYEAINAIDAPDFWVSVRWKQVGRSAPPMRAFSKQIEGWLRKLDADTVAELPSQDWPRATVTVGDWVLGLKALPIARERRGKPKDGLIGIGPAIAGYAFELIFVELARSRLEERSKRRASPICDVALDIT